MTCPACGGEDIKKLSVLWDEITSGSQPSLERLEAAVTAQLADVSDAPGSPAESREAVRTLLMRELAPPQKRADLPVGGSCLQMSLGLFMVFGGLVMVVLASIRLAATHLGFPQIAVIVLGGLAIAGLGYTVGRVGFPKPTYKEYAERLEAWQCTYRCMQCGNHFAVDTEPPPPATPAAS